MDRCLLTRWLSLRSSQLALAGSPDAGARRRIWQWAASYDDLLSLLLILLALVACVKPPMPPTAAVVPTPVRTPTPVPATDEEAILQLLAAEGEGVVQQDIERLMEIWAEDGVVMDGRHTPDDGSDDLTWRGRDAIRQRYVTLVFPGNPSVAGATDVQLTIEGNAAEALSTTRIGSEIAPSGDRWTFARREGRWLITSLTYNLEPE